MKYFFYFFMLSSGLMASNEVPPIFVPGGAWWKPKTTLKLKRKLVLTAPTRLDADEVILEYPIITNGHRLDIHGRKIIFGPEASIDTFGSPAPTGLVGANHGGPAKASSKESVAGTDGSNGLSGNQGADGLGADGLELPGEIFIFGSEIIGNPSINGLGQNGGAGGKGGAGQTGGEGSPGKKAFAADPCWFVGSSDAGNGSDGGSFGKGGAGGAGGRGGSPVPVTLLTAWKSPSQEFSRITCDPGSGGTGGESGAPGNAGQGGPGGAGDSNSCWFFGIVHNNKSPGSAGKAGLKCECNEGETTGCVCKKGDLRCIEEKCTLRKGRAGTVGTPFKASDLELKLKRSRFDFIKNYADYEKRRFEVMLSWYDFHWRRHFEDVLHGSMFLLDDLEISSNEENTKTEPDPVLDGAIQNQISETVSLEWKNGFVAPLSKQETKYASDPKILARLQWAKEKAQKYSGLLAQIKSKGAGAVVVELKQLFKSIGEERSKILESIAKECSRYVSDVLKGDEYKKRLAQAQYHYDIPACLEIQLFSEAEEGPLRPIELVRNIEPYVSDGSKDSVSIETMQIASFEKPSTWNFFTGEIFNYFAFGVGFPSSAWAGRKPLLSSFNLVAGNKLSRETLMFAYPTLRNAARLGELGVHKGYLSRPHEVKDLNTLRSQLHFLNVLVGSH